MSSFPITEEIPLPPSSEPDTSTTDNTLDNVSSVSNANLQSVFNPTNIYSNTLYNQQAAAYYAANQTAQAYNVTQLGAPSNSYPYYLSINQLTGLQQIQQPSINQQSTLVGEKLSKKQRKKLAAAEAAALAEASANHEHADDRSGNQEDIDDDPTVAKGHKGSKANNILPIWGNEKTMNLNPLLLTNIQNSPYFKVSLYALKTYHEVIDEIWYQVKHMEPWEKGSRRVSGQTGMCGSVRGVGAGGIVSTPFCILYKLYTLRLTRKQVMGLIKHKDSPYIRAIGFMYIRYTQPPEHLWSWFSHYLEDKEEFDPKAGGGQKMTIGAMVRHMLIKLDWFSTLFPRIPVPIQKDIEKKLEDYDRSKRLEASENYEEGELDENEEIEGNQEISDHYNQDSSYYRDQRHRSRERSRNYSKLDSRSRSDKRRNRSRSFEDSRDRSRDRSRSRSKERLKRRYRSRSRSFSRSNSRGRSEERRRSKDRKYKYSDSKKKY